MAEVIGEGDMPTTADSHESIGARLARLWYRLDGCVERMKALFDGAQTKMDQWSDENPPPDPADRSRNRDFTELAQAISRAAAMEYARLGKLEIHTQHHEGGPRNNGEKAWKEKLIFPLLVMILGAAILGGLGSWARLGSVQTQVEERTGALAKTLDDNNRATQQRIDDFIRANEQRHEDVEKRLLNLESKATH